METSDNITADRDSAKLDRLNAQLDRENAQLDRDSAKLDRENPHTYRCNKYVGFFFVFVLVQLLVSASIFYVVMLNSKGIHSNTHELQKGPRFTLNDWRFEQKALLLRLEALEERIQNDSNP